LSVLAPPFLFPVKLPALSALFAAGTRAAYASWISADKTMSAVNIDVAVQVFIFGQLGLINDCSVLDTIL
jgi:hypothetical protein